MKTTTKLIAALVGMPGIKKIEWSGAIIGLLGSALLSMNIATSGYGFVLFLVSNAFWIGYGIKNHAWGMVTMQAGYTMTSLNGIIHWLHVV
jgi:hypothetical protein